jgi:hypothetical protein
MLIKTVQVLAIEIAKGLISKLIPKAIEYLGADLRNTRECFHLRPSGMRSFVPLRACPGYSVTICTECGAVEVEEIEIKELVGRLELN